MTPALSRGTGESNKNNESIFHEQGSEWSQHILYPSLSQYMTSLRGGGHGTSDADQQEGSREIIFLGGAPISQTTGYRFFEIH